jgi:hypothetical protein
MRKEIPQGGIRPYLLPCARLQPVPLPGKAQVRRTGGQVKSKVKSRGHYTPSGRPAYCYPRALAGASCYLRYAWSYLRRPKRPPSPPRLPGLLGRLGSPKFPLPSFVSASFRRPWPGFAPEAQTGGGGAGRRKISPPSPFFRPTNPEGWWPVLASLGRTWGATGCGWWSHSKSKTKPRRYAPRWGLRPQPSKPLSPNPDLKGLGSSSARTRRPSPNYRSHRSCNRRGRHSARRCLSCWSG